MAGILIIDDEALVRLTLRQILEAGGHTVVEAENGDKAIHMLENFHADLVITDLLMPEKEGLETIRELRRSRPDVRIIAMSGGGRLNGQDFLEIARKLGAHDTLSKPFGTQKLRELVAEVLG